jgi:SAM-dependent methyltransferase
VLNEKTDVVDLFSAANGKPGLQRRFLEAMHRLGLWEGERLAGMFPFSEIKTLLDVGGGSGALAISLAERFPHLTITLFDRPSVCAMAEEYVGEAQRKDRIHTLPGDFWQDALPFGADAILLSMVLHDWSPEKNLELLKRCHDVLPSGGRVLIFEQLLQQDRYGPVVACLTNLTMLLRTESGMEYTEGDYHKLLLQAGFLRPQTIQTPGLRQLLYAEKP